MTEIIPTLLIERWQEAHAKPSMLRWKATAELALRLWAEAKEQDAHLLYLSDLATLCDLAHQHQLDCQPERIDCV